MFHGRLQFFHPNPATIPQYKLDISQRYASYNMLTAFILH